MTISATAIRSDDVTVRVELDDGRAIGVPLAWFPQLLGATTEQREQYRIGVTGNGLSWEAVDEDISVEGLLANRGALTVRPSVAT